jgi:hypothetical protein
MSQEGVISFASFSPRGSYRECFTLDRRISVELVYLDTARKLYWRWRGGSAKLCFNELLLTLIQLSSLLPLMPLPPTHPLVQMFQIKTLNELHNPSENELGLCNRLLNEDFFPNSLWVMSLRACVLYHLHGSSHADHPGSPHIFTPSSIQRLWTGRSPVRTNPSIGSVPN